MVPPQVPVEVHDGHIFRNYTIRKCWRYRAEQKQTGQANLQYIRHGRFYVIMATEGEHPFKVRERTKLRDVRSTPLVVPLQSGVAWAGKTKKQKRRNADPRLEECYVIGYERGRYERKTAEERAAYKKAVEAWRQNKFAGIKVAKPARGKEKNAWHPTAAIEDTSYARLWDYFITYATKWSSEKLAIEFRRTPYEPYWAVKRQLFEILCEVNRLRHTASLDKLPYKVVNTLKRDQIFPFEPLKVREERPTEADQRQVG
jgi:hypothetical protein